MTQEDTTKYLRKLYRFLDSGHQFIFGRYKYNGYIIGHEEDKNIHYVYIHLDHRRDVLSTLLHEFIHYQHPDWSESKVLRMESLFVNSLTDRQVRNIIKRFAQAL